MKLRTLDRARINALWGTIFLFLLPITLGLVYVLAGFQSKLLLVLFGFAGLASGVAGFFFFLTTVNQLQQASKEKLGKTET
jgi:hypothetical protein